MIRNAARSLRAPNAGAGDQWYRPSQSRYDWEWLRRRCDRDSDGAVTLQEFGGPREWFEALDRDVARAGREQR